MIVLFNFFERMYDSIYWRFCRLKNNKCVQILTGQNVVGGRRRARESADMTQPVREQSPGKVDAGQIRTIKTNQAPWASRKIVAAATAARKAARRDGA